MCRWAVVEEEVKEAVRLGLPVLTPVEVQEQLFRAVLRCGHFNLVQKYISGKITPSIPTTSNLQPILDLCWFWFHRTNC